MTTTSVGVDEASGSGRVGPCPTSARTRRTWASGRLQADLRLASPAKGALLHARRRHAVVMRPIVCEVFQGSPVGHARERIESESA
jgi:hypothetical protein